MFGEDGWCRSCGVPRHAQIGSLVLRRKSFKVQGAWVPYWQYDAICIEKGVADEIVRRFRVDLIEVEWHATSPGEARQIIAPSVGDRWFDPDQLRARAVAAHGTPGAKCPACGVWRWLPLGFAARMKVLPPLLDVPAFEDYDVVASPEWFGDGMSAFRQILVRRELAAILVSASPRDFEIVEPVWA
jgi:hypothetical protein